MQNFTYNIPTKIYFGEGQIKRLGKQIAKYGKKVLLVYGGGSIKRNGIYGAVIEQLNSHNLEYVELGGVKPNPRIDSVREGVELCHKENVDFVLAVGGGSSIDCAKVIAVAANYDGDAWDVVESPEKVINSGLPLASVLTLSATGSEMDAVAVISDLTTNKKYGTGHPSMAPKFSILDPTYTYTVPKNQTAAGAADILCHVFEVYFSVTDSAYLQNRMAEGIMRTVVEYAKKAMDEPENYEARANLMWASSLAINGLLSYGKLTEWTMHAMEHELSAFYDITHGVGLAILMPRWMEMALNPETEEKFAEFAKNVFYLDRNLDNKTLALQGIEAVKQFLYQDLALPSSLSAVGIDETNFERMAEKSTRKGENGVIGNFLKLNKDDIIKIYQNSL